MALKMTRLDNCEWIDRHPGEQWWDQFVANLTCDMMEDVSFFFFNLVCSACLDQLRQ